jgi:hypothetical protein
MAKLEIKYISIDEIKPYERNNKKHPQNQIDKLKKQVEIHGWDVPIVVDENNIIIKGHGRLEAAKQLNMKTIPCIIRTDLTEDQKKAARIADNKLSELAEIHFDNLKIEMEELKLVDFDVQLTGFDDFSMLNVFSQEENKDEDEDSENTKERTGAKELNPEDFSEFDNICPRCNFEFNNKKEE